MDNTIHQAHENSIRTFYASLPNKKLVQKDISDGKYLAKLIQIFEVPTDHEASTSVFSLVMYFIIKLE